jgi:hypothetical protein
MFKKKKAKPWDLINPNISKVSEEIQDYRLSKCLICPELIKTTKQCKKCGCFMTQKVKLPNAECPIGKWQAEDE